MTLEVGGGGGYLTPPGSTNEMLRTLVDQGCSQFYAVFLEILSKSYVRAPHGGSVPLVMANPGSAPDESDLLKTDIPKYNDVKIKMELDYPEDVKKTNPY